MPAWTNGGVSIVEFSPAGSSGEVTLPGGDQAQPPRITGQGGGDAVWMGAGWRIDLAAGARASIRIS
jgi:hypothetical protein